MGRVDPWVGSGWVGSGRVRKICKLGGSGRVSLLVGRGRVQILLGRVGSGPNISGSNGSSVSL